MNSIVILPDEVRDGTTAILIGARARYAIDTHGVREGQAIKVAVTDGMRGEGRVLSVSDFEVALALTLTQPALAPIPVTLIVGVSRPQTIKKVIQSAVMFGVSSLHVVRSEKGDKSYLQSRSLDEDQIEEETIKAMEQIWDSRRPEIVVHRSFSHFMKQKLPMVVDSMRSVAGDGQVVKLIAHPGGAHLTCEDASRVANAATIVAIGPERGWSEDEVRAFAEFGFDWIGLGERVLRVELALVSLLGQLAILRASGVATL